MLAGPRRTGKTTVADAAVAICAREGAYVATVDLFQAPDAATLTGTPAYSPVRDALDFCSVFSLPLTQKDTLA